MSERIGSFLSRVAATLLEARAAGVHHGPLTAVLGNEGGDMDSVISAIYMSYFLNFKTHVDEGHLHHPAITHVPLLNFPAEDLPLRLDIQYALDQFQVPLDQLVWAVPSSTPEEHEKRSKLEVEDLSQGLPKYYHRLEDDADTRQELVLVDHNKLCARQAHLGKHVSSIIDHHADERMYVEATEKNLRCISTVGSCASKVALLFKQHGVPVADPKLLMAPILLDTMNLDPAMKKVTPTDVEAIEFLLAQNCIDEVEPPLTNHYKSLLDSWYATLSAKKSEVTHLTLAQSLRRDFKAFPFNPIHASFGLKQVQSLSIGISAVVEPDNSFIDRMGGLETVAEGVMKQCSAVGASSSTTVDIGAIMFAFHDPSTEAFTRSLLLVIPILAGGERHQLLSQFVESQGREGTAGLQVVQEKITDLPLGLVQANATTPTPASGGESTVQTVIMRMSQSDSTVSRKGLVPSLSNFLLKAEGKL